MAKRPISSLTESLLGVFLFILLQHFINVVEGFIDVFSSLCSCQYDLPAGEDKKDNLGVLHSVDKSREDLGLIGAKSAVLGIKALKTDRETDIARTDNVLDQELLELHTREANLLDHLGIHLGRCVGLLLTLGACDDHLARAEDQCRGLGLSDTYNHCGKSLRIVFSISTFSSDFSEVKLNS